MKEGSYEMKKKEKKSLEKAFDALKERVGED